jgi:hypothetical protein
MPKYVFFSFQFLTLENPGNMGLGTSVFFHVAENAYLIVPQGAGHPAILSNVIKEGPSNIVQVVGLFIILGYIRHMEICTICE